MLVTGGAHFTTPATPEPTDNAGSAAYPLIFPVGGDHSYVDTFGAPRSGGRTHQGADIFADKLTPVLASADGTIIRVAVGELAGRYIVIQHTDGWRSYYLHLNNDSPETDDGLGGESVEGIREGALVKAGQVLDFVGDSGNAEETPSHLHFELHGPGGSVVNPYPHLRAAEGGRAAPGTFEVGAAGWVSEYEETNTTMVGHFDPGGGFAAGVVVQEHTAYLGTWGLPGYCPNTGIRVIDVADPASPALIGVLADGADFPGTRAETLWIGPVQTPSFEGNLGVVPIRLCENSERDRRRGVFRGLALYDMADPSSPVLLSTWHSGDRTQGANDVSVAQRADGVLLAATTVRQSLLHTKGEIGDVRLLDISNPFRPAELTDWDNRRDGRPVVGDHDEEEFHARHVTLTSDGMSAWVSHWDAGTVLLDLEDLSTPRFVSAIGFAAEGEGNRHSSVFFEEAGLLVANEEDLFPFDGASHLGGWGIQHIYDVGDPTAPVEIATFATERAVDDGTAELALDGFFSVHDTVLSGSVAISSWYSDGVRIVDLSNPAQPTEIGSFVPPRSRDPVGYWVAPSGAHAFPMVWGVDVTDDLVYVSDMNSGLWIIRFGATRPTSERIGPAPG
jgi:hypothetical protein